MISNEYLEQGNLDESLADRRAAEGLSGWPASWESVASRSVWIAGPMNGKEVVASTTDVAFAVNARGRLVAWNEEAEKLFGHKASEILGRRCWEVLAGRDVFGNDHCQEECQLRQMAVEGRSIHPCELVFRNALGESVQARVSLLTVGPPGAKGTALVHLLCPIRTEVEDRPTFGPKVHTNHANSRLTPRELEVLVLVAGGRQTTEIAEELGLALVTTRNHIQHILKKLRVHSRMEAVALARRLGLVS